MVEHRSILRLVRNTDYVQLEANDVVAQASTISFDAATFEIWGALLAGARLVIVSKEQLLLPVTLARKLEQHGVTVLFVTTAIFNQIARETVQAFARLRYLLFGGEKVEPQWVKRVLAEAPPQHLLHVYGPTETVTFASWCELNARDCEQAIPIGRPITNTRMYILDARQEPVPMGVAGELYIGGPGVARGYLNQPELTAERFVQDPFATEPGARLYKTGDLGRFLPDGHIEFLGRNDFQVKIRGFRIELGEIETRLAEHPVLRDAVVIAREDTPGDKRLVAYYVTHTEQPHDPGADGLRAHLSGSLPEYMVPAAYMRLDRLPLTLNGKLDRKALPAPDASAYSLRGYEEPQGELETLLAQIFAEVLKLDRVGRHDNFFELGGHSLLAVQLMSRIQQALPLDIRLAQLFAHPTLSEIARLLQNAASAQLPPIVPADRGKPLPLSFAQQRLWFLAQMEGVSETYHMPFGLQLNGTLHRSALRQALDHILLRHEALRTCFPSLEGQPVQQIIPVECSRFRLLEQSASHAELLRIKEEEARQPFDLALGPLIRGRLVQHSEQQHTLLVTMHHIVSDGWSMSLFLNELSALYGAYRQGVAPALAPLPLQYADYAVWQRQWVSGPVLQAQAEYWKNTLAGAPAFAGAAHRSSSSGATGF